MLLSFRHCLPILFLIGIVACWLAFRSPPYFPATTETLSIPSPQLPLLHSIEDASNETLGFQKILALSHGASWRTRGLAAAANLTGLQITIPPQPPINPDMINAFSLIGSHGQEKDHPTPGRSSAWLAHLDLIKYFYQSNLGTALVIEDDVDWDINLKVQMKSIASAVRSLTKTPENVSAPYGQGWDVLWIGHCGEYWEEGFETVVFDDVAVCPQTSYNGWAKQYISRLPDGRRSVYWSNNPVCSFAYALTHGGARKVLELTGSGQGEAFDVKMMGEC